MSNSSSLSPSASPVSQGTQDQVPSKFIPPPEYKGFGLSDLDSRDLGTLENEVNCGKNFMLAWFDPRFPLQPVATVCVLAKSSEYKLTVLCAHPREAVFVVREKFNGRRKRMVSTVFGLSRGHVFGTFDEVVHAYTGELRRVLVANSFKKSYIEGRFSWEAVLNPPTPRDQLQEASDYMRLLATFMNPTPRDGPSQSVSPATPRATERIPFHLSMEISPSSEPTGASSDEGGTAPTQPQAQEPEMN